MKAITIAVLLLVFTISKAQVNPSPGDLSCLVAMSERSAPALHPRTDNYEKTIDSLRTPALNHIADVLIAINHPDKTFLEPRFLARPGNDELILWYIFREIYYSHVNSNQKSGTGIEMANEILSRKIDRRWLVDNYYYRIHGGIAKYFNDADLSGYNINMDSLGLEDKTEKAIFFLNTMEALAGGRFKVLATLKNNNRVLEFAGKLPAFNGKPYYYYKDFGYDDFDWIGYDKTESYNNRHIDGFYTTLMVHYIALAESGNKAAAMELYSNSILHEPAYFKFSSSNDNLQLLYNKYK